jgi:cbb3-type cytochrome oxidase maturation protein
MALGVWVFFGWMVVVVFSGIAFLVWAWRNGQFRDVEEAKYRMLEDREPEPWPKRCGRRDKGGGA